MRRRQSIGEAGAAREASRLKGASDDFFLDKDFRRQTMLAAADVRVRFCPT